MDPNILVIGGNSKIGGQLIRRLTERMPVRALARSAESQRAVAALGAEPVPGDLTQPNTLDTALSGVERVFLLSSPHPDLASHRNAVVAAQRAGIRHLVRSSVLGADPEAPARMARLHGESDRYLQRSGVPFTILRPNYFMQNVLEVIAPSIDAGGNFYGSAGTARLSMVDTRDVAEVAATVLTQGDRHAGRAYDLTGPEALSYDDVAAKLSQVTGREAAYVDLPYGATREALLGLGTDTWTVAAIVELFASYQASGVDGWAARVTDAIPVILGRRARTLDDLLAESQPSPALS
jgi:uncharacterized protein YbjT (DUF2867 family)